MKIITAMMTDFDHLARGSDEDIIQRFLFYVRNARKQVIPKSVAAIGKTVLREPQKLTISLFDSQQRLVAQYCFVPIPPFR